MILAVVYLITTTLTEMISNNAVAILMTPIAMETPRNEVQPHAHCRRTGACIGSPYHLLISLKETATYGHGSGSRRLHV